MDYRVMMVSLVIHILCIDDEEEDYWALYVQKGCSRVRMWMQVPVLLSGKCRGKNVL